MNENPSRRWLLVSLVLNVFLAGAIVGGGVRWWLTERPAVASAAAPSRSLRSAADDLSAEQRRAFRVALGEARRAAAVALRAAQAERQEVLRLMREPQFDHAAVSQALARTRDADVSSRVRYEATVADFAATLSADERQKFADGLARRSAPAASAPASAKP